MAVYDYLAKYVGNRLFNPLRPAIPDVGWEGRMGSARSHILYPDGGFSIAHDHKYTVLMNGINTSLDEFKQMLGYHSTLCGRGVIGVWNATHGITKDLLECGVNLVGKRATNPSLKFVECCLTVMQNDPAALIHCYCHSQAAIHVSNGLTLLPEWVRKRIIVTAIAPACQIDDRLCRNVRSFISTRDFIPFLDLGGTVRNFRHCTFLRPSPGAPFLDHTYFSPTYRKEIIARDKFFQRERL